MPATASPPIDIRPDHWVIVRSILQKHVPQYEVWAFGSRAKRTAKKYSDLDLAIITDQPLSLSISAALSDDFSESDLPWKVDIVDWATTSESFRKIIERDNVVVQKAKKERVIAGEWQRCEIGKAFSVNPPRTITRGQVTPFIPMDALPEHERSPNRIDEREFTGSGMKFQNGDTLIARITPCLENGKTAFISGLSESVVGHGSTEYIVIAGKPGETDNLFAYYLARSPEFRQYATSHMEGTSGRQRVPSVAVENYTIALPPLSEQRAIAHILGTLDDKIELNRRMNETLETIARAMFKSWFVDFDPVCAKASGEPPESICRRLRLPPDLLALFPDRLVDSELGEIPEGWEVKPLPVAIDVNPVRTLRKGVIAPYLDMANMPTTSIRALSVVGREFGSGIKFQNGDTLVARITPCLENGKTCFVDFLNDGQVGWGSTEYIVLRPKRALPDEFAYFLARTDTFRNHAIANMTGTSGRQRVPTTALDRFPLVIPETRLAAEFGYLARGIITKMRTSDAESASLSAIRDTLLPKLLSGELRVPKSVRKEVLDSLLHDIKHQEE